MTDMSNHPAPAVDLRAEFCEIEEKVDRTHHLLAVLAETFGNGLLVQLHLSTKGQRDSAEQVHSLIEVARTYTERARTGFETNYHAFEGLFERQPAAPARHVSVVRAADHPQIAGLRRKWSEALQNYREAASAWSSSTPETEGAYFAAIDSLMGTPAPDIRGLQLKFQLLDAGGTQARGLHLGWIEADVARFVDFQNRGIAIRTEPEAQWDEAMAAYNAAVQAEFDYEAGTYGPAWDRQKAFEEQHPTGSIDELKALRVAQPEEFIPDEIADEYDRLIDTTGDLRRALIKLPAPNAEALRWKLDTLLAAESGDSNGDGGAIAAWTMNFLAQTIADYRRILSGEG